MSSQYSIHDFTALIKKDGLARQNRFVVSIPLPEKLSSSHLGSKFLDFQLLCRSVSVAGINVATQQYRTTGEMTNIPYDRTFSGSTFNFVADRNLIVRELFEQWVNLIQNRRSRILGYYNDIVSKITIDVLNRMNNKVYSLMLYDAFPKSIGDLSVDNSSNELMILPITFEYKYYDTFVNDADSMESTFYASPEITFIVGEDTSITDGSLETRGGLNELFKIDGKTFLKLPGEGVMNNVGATAQNLGPVQSVIGQVTGIAQRRAEEIFQQTTTRFVKEAAIKVFPNISSINLKF